MSSLTTSIFKNQDYGEALDKIAAYISTNTLTAPQKMVLIDFFKSEFKTVRPDELLEAVKGAISGRIEPPKDITKIQRLSAGWFGSILQGYKKHRQAERMRNAPIEIDDRVRLLSDMRGKPGRGAEYYKLLEKWYKDFGGLPKYGWAWKECLDYLKETDQLLTTNADQNTIRNNAKAYCTQKPDRKGVSYSDKSEVSANDLERETMRLHLKRLTNQTVKTS